MGAVARQELVAELLPQRDVAREHVGRQQPFDEVVVAAVAVAPREAEHARDGVRLEHGAHGVRRHAEPVGRRPALGARSRATTAGLPRGSARARARPTSAFSARSAPGSGSRSRGTMGTRSPGRRRAPCCTPRRSCGAGRARRTTRLVVGDARVQHEVVAPAGNRDRVELDRAEPAEDLEDGVEASLEATAPAPGNAGRRETGARPQR